MRKTERTRTERQRRQERQKNRGREVNRGREKDPQNGGETETEQEIDGGETGKERDRKTKRGKRGERGGKGQDMEVEENATDWTGVAWVWSRRAQPRPHLTRQGHGGGRWALAWPNLEDPRLAPGAPTRHPAAVQNLPHQSAHPTAMGPLYPSAVSLPEPLCCAFCPSALRGWVPEALDTMVGGSGAAGRK